MSLLPFSVKPKFQLKIFNFTKKIVLNLFEINQMRLSVECKFCMLFSTNVQQDIMLNLK